MNTLSQSTDRDATPIQSPELRYSKVLFTLSISLLLLVPLIWIARSQPLVTALSHAQLTLEQAMLAPIPPTTTQLQQKALPLRDYNALVTSQSHKSLALQPGEKIRVWVDFRNIGSKTWAREGNREFIAMNVTGPVGRISPFQSADWDNGYNRYYYRPGRMSQASVKSGDVARFYITLQAPAQAGTYTERFGLVAEHKEWLAGGNFTLSIIVKPATASAVDNTRKGETTRVGIWNTDKNVEISSTGEFKIKDATGKLIAVYHRGEIVTVNYQQSVYTLQAPNSQDPRGWNATSTAYLVFEPAPGQLIEILNYESRPTWNTGYNDNYFRGKLEYRHSSLTNKTWVINTLPMEAYVRGIAEVSTSTPKEMQKAMAIAERTYAEYHRRAYSKHAKDYFHVDNRYDQVYKGAGFEFRAPSVTQAVADTTGTIVTYNGKLAITPYFSRSDGKTRSFTEVWGGSGQPWLIGVDVPWSKGKTLLGHGVGMDASAGVQMASQGLAADYILKYFYTGTTLTKIY